MTAAHVESPEARATVSCVKRKSCGSGRFVDVQTGVSGRPGPNPDAPGPLKETIVDEADEQISPAILKYVVMLLIV